MTSCLMTPESNTNYTLFVMSLTNQTNDTVVFASRFTPQYTVLPGDTVFTDLAISTETEPGKDSEDKVFNDLKKNFMTRSFDTCLVATVVNKVTVVNSKIWGKPIIDAPVETNHTFFNVNAWKMLYDVKGHDILLFTINESDLK